MDKSIILKRLTGFIIKLYNHIIAWKILNSDLWFFRKCKNFLVYLVCNSKELYACFGKLNPDKTFYVIRDPHRKAGLFAVHSFVVGHIRHAVKNGMIPIVDMQHYPNMYYTDKETIGKMNWWEFCFKQPFPYSLEEVYHSKNVVLCNGLYDGQLSEIFDEEKILENHEIVSKYMKLSSKAEKLCDEEWKRIVADDEKVLGVKCRGTDYTGLKPFGHSICPSAQMTIEKIEELTEKWRADGFNYERIFIATEDEEILCALKEHFKERVVYNECYRFKETGDNGLFDIMHNGYDSKWRYEQLMDYLITTYCLSRCDALIAPIVNGTLGALRIKGKYENSYIFQLGNYQ